MNMETNEDAARAAERLLCFLLGLDAGKPHHIGINDMIRTASDIRLFLTAERDEGKPVKMPSDVVTPTMEQSS